MRQEARAFQRFGATVLLVAIPLSWPVMVLAGWGPAPACTLRDHLCVVLEGLDVLAFLVAYPAAWLAALHVRLVPDARPSWAAARAAILGAFASLALVPLAFNANTLQAGGTLTPGTILIPALLWLVFSGLAAVAAVRWGIRRATLTLYLFLQGATLSYTMAFDGGNEFAGKDFGDVIGALAVGLPFFSAPFISGATALLMALTPSILERRERWLRNRGQTGPGTGASSAR